MFLPEKKLFMEQATGVSSSRTPWNKGKLIVQRPPLKLCEIRVIGIRLQLANEVRDLTLFDLLVLDSRVASIGLDSAVYAIHKMRRTKATTI